MLGGLPGNWLWVWDGRAQLQGPSFAERCRAAGITGVLIKAFDGSLTSGPWGPWNAATVDPLRAAGLKVGLWGFCYGQGPTSEAGYDDPHTVDDELRALDAAVKRCKPEAIVLNIEVAVMRSPTPDEDVANLVIGAKRHGMVGVSSVWRWVNWSKPWPFKAAVEGGVNYWANQIYPESWGGSVDYVAEAAALAKEHGGGKPDYPALYCAPPATGATMIERTNQALAHGATGVNWWAAQFLNEDRWSALAPISARFGPPSERDAADAAFDAFAKANPHLGALLNPGAGFYQRTWAGSKVALYENGVLGYVDGAAVDITVRVLEDWTTYAERDGSLLRYR